MTDSYFQWTTADELAFINNELLGADLRRINNCRAICQLRPINLIGVLNNYIATAQRRQWEPGIDYEKCIRRAQDLRMQLLMRDLSDEFAA